MGASPSHSVKDAVVTLLHTNQHSCKDNSMLALLGRIIYMDSGKEGHILLLNCAQALICTLQPTNCRNSMERRDLEDSPRQAKSHRWQMSKMSRLPVQDLSQWGTSVLPLKHTQQHKGLQIVCMVFLEVNNIPTTLLTLPAIEWISS